MTVNTQLSDLVVDTQAQVVRALLQDGFCDIYDGEQPDGADVALGDQVLLATIRFSTFTAPVAGTFFALPITDGICIMTGRASWARATKSDHRTVVLDCSVGEQNADMNLRSTSFTRGAIVECTAFAYSVPKSTLGM